MCPTTQPDLYPAIVTHQTKDLIQTFNSPTRQTHYFLNPTIKMPSAKYTETYKKVSAMGEKLKAAGKQGPTNDEQLHLYAYAKVAEGKDFSAAKKPGMFDLAGKAKYNKWKEVVDAETSAQEAEDKYVELGEQLLAKHDN